jgi:D-alanyl-lipoteichoic acid acyltransferase DltB (MBOAT superfamily)
MLFVASLSVNFLIFTLIFVLINYSLGIGIDKFRENISVKKFLHYSGVTFNIGLLIFYKYLNFLGENLNELFSVFGANNVVPHIKVIIPIGISYYTFQGIGYILQVSRKIEKPEYNIINLINYMIFFPKFIAGPIERSKTFLPQLKQKLNFNQEQVVIGFRMILWGAFKKIVIADRLSIIINTLNGNVEGERGFIFLMVFLLQPLHLYLDFSGYTNIALGIARLFGINLIDNFNRPFFSKTIGEFWKRWHISLSSWCNDFIFNRIVLKRLKWKKWAAVYAIFITFLIIGLWHGPNWTYIVVGLLQGIAINYEFFTKRNRIKIGSKLPRNLNVFLSIVFSYLFICFTLVFFNSANLSNAGLFLAKMFQSLSIDELGVFGYTNYIIIFLGSLIVIFLDFLEEFKGVSIFSDVSKLSLPVKWMIYFLLTYLVVFQGGPESTFVYMQF